MRPWNMVPRLVLYPMTIDFRFRFFASGGELAVVPGGLDIDCVPYTNSDYPTDSDAQLPGEGTAGAGGSWQATLFCPTATSGSL